MVACGKVRPSTRPTKKVMQTCTDETGKKYTVHAGAAGMKNNYSKEARKNFRRRMKCQTAKPGTARYLACEHLWSTKDRRFDTL